VTQHLVTDIRCRTLFATHYHTLCDDFAGSGAVALGHMGCLVEEGEGEGEGGGGGGRGGGAPAPRVTFLYKFAAGACPKSYGLNVARLARLPESIIQRAAVKSAEFEAAVLEAEETQRNAREMEA
jgi:DNA mismatch repair protein MSH6